MNIAIMTARSGSKSVPQKNIRMLGPLPLLGWGISALSKSTKIDKIILSTDSEKYFEIGKSINSEIIFHKRSPELAEDVPSELIILDVDEKFKELFNKDSVIVLIQPPTPFISNSDIDECVRYLETYLNMNTCISVKVVSEHPEWMITKFKEHQGTIDDFSGKKGVRQELPTRWVPNGGIYAIRTEFLLNNKKIIDNNTLIHEMPTLQSIDIDEEDDFILCETLVKSGMFSPIT